ncbi:MAG TPA: hypothetical protein VGD52_05520 [Pseudoduganella sp.]
MTLPKRKSRSIEVEQVRHRYIISKPATENKACFKLNLTIQVESGHGSILKVEGLSTRDLWLDFPKLESTAKYPVLKPQHVAALIRHALTQGWAAERVGTPFLLNASGHA